MCRSCLDNVVEADDPGVVSPLDETPSLVQDTMIILDQLAVNDSEVEVCARRSKFYPEPVSLATILIIARRDTVDDRWLRAAHQIHGLLLQKDFQTSK